MGKILSVWLIAWIPIQPVIITVTILEKTSRQTNIVMSTKYITYGCLAEEKGVETIFAFFCHT